VGNIPGAVPRTSTYALTNATLPHAVALATRGPAAAVATDPALAGGVNTVAGHVTNPAVAEALGRPFTSLEAAWAEATG
jgi:alanine dehydrogenase